MDVRDAAPGVRVIDIDGEVTAFSEQVLMDAFAEASGAGVRAVILNFEGLQYMNSGGIGLLVTVLIRANRAGQQLLAYGLNEHYRQILSLTRLDEAIGVHADEESAVAAAR
ncbi:MAG TPA: STAS domain-containing protein [Acidimicrobiia bacterium]|nr:STAS domain-containing protein [Acidimicrobiia bacterium]